MTQRDPRPYPLPPFSHHLLVGYDQISPEERTSRMLILYREAMEIAAVTKLNKEISKAHEHRQIAG